MFSFDPSEFDEEVDVQAIFGQMLRDMLTPKEPTKSEKVMLWLEKHVLRPIAWAVAVISSTLSTIVRTIVGLALAIPISIIAALIGAVISSLLMGWNILRESWE